MSSKCIVTIKNENWLKREIMLQQYTDGHPNNMLLPLVTELREIYQEFKEFGDPDWFLDPGKLAGLLVTRSVPVFSEEVKSVLKSLPSSTKNRLENNLFLGIPSLLPDVRVYDANYEYSITLKETPEGFFGYILEVYRLQNNKRYSSVNVMEENFNKELKVIPPLYEEIEEV